MNLEVDAGAAPPNDSARAPRFFSAREELGGLGQQLVSFVEPLLAEGDGSPEHERNILELGRACWQIALQEPEIRAHRIREIEAILCTTDEEREALRSLIASLIERHRAMFPSLHRA
jgi:hypothetical protein